MLMPPPGTFLPANPIAGRTTLLPSPEGLVTGTLVETEAGWRTVEHIGPGDRIATLDGGFAEVVAVTDLDLGPGPLVVVPPLQIGNCSEIWLLPDQELLLPTWRIEELVEEVFALVPASMLCGRGIGAHLRQCPRRARQVRFAGEEIVWANTGVLLRCGQAPASDFPRLPPALAARLVGEHARADGDLAA